MPYMTKEEIIKYPAFPWVRSSDMKDALKRTHDRVVGCGLYQPNQVLGRRTTIGCVSLEVTQRCNLDCTLCYLSENSESVKDIPIEEVFRRIDQIKAQYGPLTDVQISGGDPTMRDRNELIAIVKKIKDVGMRPTLMTNGHKCPRDLLVELIKHGLNDVAFHVDTTQRLKKYKSEIELNQLRLQFIERVRGLPIAVIFNTTVHAGNFHEIPEMIRFFKKHADVVGFASFQLQAETGRGELRERDDIITVESVKRKIQEGAGIPISFDTILIGHRDCNNIGITLECNGNLYDLNDSPEFFSRIIEAIKSIELDRRYPLVVVKKLLAFTFKNPWVLPSVVKWMGPKIWRAKWDLIKSRGKVNKITFFIHNFMGAGCLEKDRIDACSFMVMTAEGPISMCLHNAKRDAFILKELSIRTADGEKKWNPLTGKYEDANSRRAPIAPSRDNQQSAQL